MKNIQKHIMGGFAALVYLTGALSDKVDKLHTLEPEHYPDNALAVLTMLFQPQTHPLYPVYALAPLCFAAAIFMLYQFSLSSRSPLTGSFNLDSLKALRIAGILFCVGAGAMAWEPILAKWVIGAPHLPIHDAGSFFLFIVIGGALASISRNGNVLFSNARTLRSELDEIV